MKKGVMKSSQLLTLLVFIGLQAIVSVHADSDADELIFQPDFVEDIGIDTEVIITENNSFNYESVVSVRSDDQVFGYNPILGFDVSFGKNLTSFIEYKYLEVNDVNSDQFGGGSNALVGELQNDHAQLDSVGVGLRYTF